MVLCTKSCVFVNKIMKMNLLIIIMCFSEFEHVVLMFIVKVHNTGNFKVTDHVKSVSYW